MLARFSRRPVGTFRLLPKPRAAREPPGAIGLASGMAGAPYETGDIGSVVRADLAKLARGRTGMPLWVSRAVLRAFRLATREPSVARAIQAFSDRCDPWVATTAARGCRW